MPSKNPVFLSFLVRLLLIAIFFISSGCGIYKPVDARKVNPNAEERAKKNLEEGKGFRLFKPNGAGMGGAFQFASSNELWRASLDIIDFMPLSSVNYSGGIIITDWYSENKNPNESIKISIRFLTNEIRSDALDIKIFSRICDNSSLNCKFTDSGELLVSELKKEILKKATIYDNEEKKEKKE